MHIIFVTETKKAAQDGYNDPLKLATANHIFGIIQTCLGFAGLYTMNELAEHGKQKVGGVGRHTVTHTFTITITSTSDVGRDELHDTIVQHLDDFGNGDYWDEDTEKTTIGQIMVDDTLVADFAEDEDEEDAEEEDDEEEN